jgi:SPFH domain / Band 7 family
MVPFADRMAKLSIQTVVLDVPSQSTITRDNVTVGVDAVVYFRVDDPVRAVINVQNYVHAASQVAQTSLRSVIGRAELDTLLSDRDRINGELKGVIDAPTEEWGISIDRVEIKDISLPEGMRRSMSRQAEAEHDRRARVINADGELQASTKLSQAAAVMGDTPGALERLGRVERSTASCPPLTVRNVPRGDGSVVLVWGRCSLVFPRCRAPDHVTPAARTPKDDHGRGVPGSADRQDRAAAARTRRGTPCQTEP